MDISSPSGKSVLLNVDRLQGLQPSANQEQIRTLLEDYLVNDLVSAVGESLNIRGIGEESIDVKDVSEESFDSKDVGEESIDAKGVGEESIDAKGVGEESKDVGELSIDSKDVGEESKDVGELSIDSKDVGEVSIDAKDVGKVSIDAKGVGEESIDAKGVGEESKDVGELSIDSKDVGEVSIDAKDVGKESIDIKGVGVVEHAPDGDNTSGVEKRNTYEVPNAQQGNVTRKCLNKCATFPIPTGVHSPNASSIVKEEPEEVLCGDENHHHAYSRSVSLPSPSKLLSALKGSRAKEGLSPGKLSVKWAPDVYDPPATSMSHTVTGKKQQKSKNKKNWKKDGKKGQKSSSSRGKDKKQYRKSGSSGRCYRSMDPRETLVDTNNGFGELVVGSPDRPSYCGSSILKNSLANMHYPVAEAS